MAQTVKHLPAMQETQVRSLAPEDPLEKEMAPHSSTLAWKFPWMEEPGRLYSMGHKELDRTERLHFFVKSWVVFTLSHPQANTRASVCMPDSLSNPLRN